MSFKRNILANYASQIYVTLIGIVMVPLYVQYMGAEAYGLVGFFAMLQAWFQLLDMGLTPTMARETARFGSGSITALNLRRLLRAMEFIFFSIGVFGAVIMILSSSSIADHWLKVKDLSKIEVQNSIILIAIIISLRWVCGLYRGVVNGFERMVWLSGFNIFMATARFVMVIPLFIYIGASPIIFFKYQLILAVIEVGILIGKTYQLLPTVNQEKNTPWSLKPLREVMKFSLSIAFTGAVWVFVTQTDKLILSNLLPLSEYAYFTLAVLVASGVMIISGPISGALLPRLTKLTAEGRLSDVQRLYSNATQIVAVIATPVALTLAFFPEHVLWLWTGNVSLVMESAPILQLYALGNGVLALGAFPYYLQYAKGDLKLHMIGNLFFIGILVPTLIFLTLKFGAIGAGWSWLGSNVIYFLVWTYVVHKKLLHGKHLNWLFSDIGRSIVMTLITAASIKYFFIWSEDRAFLLLEIFSATFLMTVSAAAGSKYMTDKMRAHLVKITK